MDGSRFDHLTRSLAAGASRRSIIKGLLGIGAASTATAAYLKRVRGRAGDPPPGCPPRHRSRPWRQPRRPRPRPPAEPVRCSATACAVRGRARLPAAAARAEIPSAVPIAARRGRSAATARAATAHATGKSSVVRSAALSAAPIAATTGPSSVARAYASPELAVPRRPATTIQADAMGCSTTAAVERSIAPTIARHPRRATEPPALSPARAPLATTTARRANSVVTSAIASVSRR